MGQLRLLGSAWLDGFSLRFHKTSTDGSGKGDAFRTNNDKDRIYGAVFELSHKQKQSLDEFEGPGYRSIQICADSTQAPYQVVTYIAKADNIDPSLKPYEWYKALVVEGAKIVGLPCAYIQSLEQVAASVDPDRSRARLNWALIHPEFDAD